MCKHLYIAECYVRIGIHAVCTGTEDKESRRAVIQADISGKMPHSDGQSTL